MTELDHEAAELIARAETILRSTRSGSVDQLARDMFERTAPEDIKALDAHDLAFLAGETYGFLSQRLPNQPLIRIINPAPTAQSPYLGKVSILEIINDNMPFLFDSVVGALNEMGLAVSLVSHPIVSVEREPTGAMTAYRGREAFPSPALRESVIHIHLSRIESQSRRDDVIRDLTLALAHVRVAVTDWQAMKARVQSSIDALKNNPPLPVTELAEATQFLDWLMTNNFTLLGVRDYAFSNGQLIARDGTGLGILRDPALEVLRRGNEDMTMTPAVREFLMLPVPLIITKANMRSKVHRRVYMDYIGVKTFDADGHVTGELRIVGLFTATAYTRSTRSIPYLRYKVDRVLQRAGFDPEGHSGKALHNVLESYPRDELFQIDDETLYRNALDILQLGERPRLRVLARHDRFNRFVSVLVFVPKESYDSRSINLIGDALAKTYKGRRSAHYTSLPDGVLARIHYIIGLNDPETPTVERAVLESTVRKLIRTWSDDLTDQIALVHEAGKATDLSARYKNAFSAAYREAEGPEQAVRDIRILEGMSDKDPIAIDFYRPDPQNRAVAGLKVFSLGRSISLSERVPILEAMGFTVVEESSFDLHPEGRSTIAMHNMVLTRPHDAPIDLEALDEKLEAMLIAIMRGDAENDGYNALTLEAGLGWRDIAALRTLSRYLHQLRVPFSQNYMWETLRKHSGATKGLALLFHIRFDPALGLSVEERLTRQSEVISRLEDILKDIASLDEDRILRHFINLLQAAVRTNFFQTDQTGKSRPTICFKMEAAKVEGMPAPRPLYEITVYSPRVEGIHMRFGKVARGGLRWSDRPQDFRTEVLGLVKAQQVKNTVIVPVGAKGGFVPKRLPPSSNREAWLSEGTESYRTFIRALLDVTDNVVGDGVSHPDNTIRYDGDDPYLVVAADKGTATFSDTANAISIERGHWLGDAFASGGSVGYDHKKMGITARGAWEAVKRHFREIDINIHTTPFTVAGVGDMSGDVFGNGMLLENTIQLVAAFDHRDIFIDPTPDAQASFAERQRLFALPRSSWADYNKALISKGGGIFSRSAKAIDLTPEMQALLELHQDHATPQEVMNAILKMKVDLLWFGGIGTYVRSSNETDDMVGDRANDAIRIAGKDIQAKVVGEGANLGMTQRGRIEAARKGVRLNTDAIDNSAGVNSSDLEVNIKIALATPVKDGRLSEEARNTLLASMTDEVGALVLRNNYLQTLSISLAQRSGLDDLGFQQRLMHTLEQTGRLSRSVEFLPEDSEIAERRAKGEALSRPELAVLLAYAKLSLYDTLLASNVPDDPYLAKELMRYFPSAMQSQFPDALESHRLRREIISTGLTNSIINRGGPGFIVRVADETGADVGTIASAFALVRDAYGMTALNTALDGYDNKVSGKVMLELYGAVQSLLIDRVVWFIRNADLSKGLAELIAHHRKAIEQVEASLDKGLPQQAQAARKARMNELVEAGLEPQLASVMASLNFLAMAPDIAAVADKTGKKVADVAATLFAAGEAFRLDGLRDAAKAVPASDYFDRLALDRALSTIALAERKIGMMMVETGEKGDKAVKAWMAQHGAKAERIRTSINEIVSSGLTISKATVAASMLGDLVE